MDTTIIDPTIPQWKRDLIRRLRNKNKWFADSCDEQEQQLLAGNSSVEFGPTVQQPNLTCSSSSTNISTDAVVVPVVTSDYHTPKCYDSFIKMVKDRVIDCDLENNCVSSDNEELHYGPGIVKKLKNHYLSLTLRECNVQVRPSILPLRKATSLENLLDDVEPNNKPSRYKPRFKENVTKNFTNNRYYNASRGVDLKRARSVEAISRSNEQQQHIEEPLNDSRLKHQSFHEEMLIVKEGNGVSENIHDNTTLTLKETKPFSNTVNHKINRPKRITPLMSEKEKPPVDVVKQTKRIFEGKAEQRTKQPYQTGDVAAKVASYRNIIGQTRNNKKPPVLKQKPAFEDNRKSLNIKLPPKQKPFENEWKNETKQSPDIALIPDVSIITSPREEICGNQVNLSETPDLILHSSPVKSLYSPTYRILATDNFLQAEIVYSSDVCGNTKQNRGILNGYENDELDGTPNNIGKAGNTITFNMSNLQGSRSHLPNINNAEGHISPPAPLSNITLRKDQLPYKKTDTIRVVSPILVTALTLQEIQKNHINTTKTVKVTPPPAPSLVTTVENLKNTEVIKKIQVPKNSLSRISKEQNSIVFKFTDRRDVPDYVYNDGKIRTGKIDKPKVGEGGIILLPGVSLDESLVDDEDDWMLILEGPPSPCDIEFVNGNVLIDGRSSLSQKSKKPKMRIKFVEAMPDIFEYPSEASLSSEYNRSTSPIKEAPTINIVPTLTGTSLANYIPKSGPIEEFQLGITRSAPTVPLSSPIQNEGSYQDEMQEAEKPVLFSSGTNTDILF